MGVRAVSVAAAAVVGLVYVSACGEDFEPYAGGVDASTDGHAGSSLGGGSGSAGASSGGSAGVGGVGGQAGVGGSAGNGGAGATGQCQLVMNPFTVIAPADLEPTQELEDELALVRHEASTSVHVAALVGSSGGQYALVARSIGDNGNTSYLAQWQSEHPAPIFTTGTAISTEVSFYGIDGSQLKKVVFPTNSQGVQDAPGSAVELTTPPECKNSGVKLKEARFAFASPSDYRLALTCSDGTQTKLFIGGSSSSFEEVDSGTDSDGTLVVNGYVFSGNVHLIQNDDGVYRFGTTAAQLAAPHQLVLSTEEGVETTGLGIIGLKSPAEGSAVLAATVKQAPLSFGLLSAALTTSQYGDLGTTSPAAFKQIHTATSTSAAVVFPEAEWATDANTIVTAATTFSGDRVAFWMFDRNLQPLVKEFEVAKMPAGTTVVAAHAAQLGLQQVVVWMTENAAGERTLMAQRIVCGG